MVHHCGHCDGHRANAAVHAAKESKMNRRDMLLSATVMAAGIAGCQLNSRAANAAANDEKKVPARNVNEAVVRYLAAWNKRDASRRLELVAKAWTEDGSYLDRVRHGRGHNEIDAMIATAQAHFPGYQLRLASGIERHHDHVRFSWVAAGTNEAPLYIKGTDFAVLAEDGRMQSVIGFVDAAPVPMSS
jgi:hypothetical protein